MKTIRRYQPVSNDQIEQQRKQYDVVLPPMVVEEVMMTKSQTADWGVIYLDAIKAWIGKKVKGENAIIFIMDTGIQDHPDLNANRKKQYDKNFTGDTPVKHPHGTHCAGIAAAVANEEGIIGVAPSAGLSDVQVLNGAGSGSYRGIAQGIRHVADVQLTGEDVGKVKIISMSLGGGTPDNELELAINYAISKGCIVIAAAGNSGFRDGQSTVNFPGAYPQVITVAALDPDNDENRANNNPASYSSAGPAVDVAAPGTNVLSAILNGGYGRMSGTSMATPHVAGIAALVATMHKAKFPANDAGNQARMEEFLRKFSLDLLTQGHDVRTGMGAPIVGALMDNAPGSTPPPPPPPAPVTKRKVQFTSPAFNYTRGEHALLKCTVEIEESLEFWAKVNAVRTYLRLVTIVNEGETLAVFSTRVQDAVGRAFAGAKAENINIQLLGIPEPYIIV